MTLNHRLGFRREGFQHGRSQARFLIQDSNFIRFEFLPTAFRQFVIEHGRAKPHAFETRHAHPL